MGTILYVEDEDADVFFMRLAFTRASLAQQLQVVVDGQAAIDYLAGQGGFGDRAQHPLPELVLLDLNLPLVSGFQVLEWIRAQPSMRSLPVIVFSSSARPDDKNRARELGATAYLEKPGSGVDFETVVETLKTNWLTSLPTPAAPPANKNSPTLAPATP